MTRRERIRYTAALALPALAVVATGVAHAQTLDPAAGAAAQGGTVSTNVTGIGCPWALVPVGVSYVRTPVTCSGAATAYTLEFAVGAGAEPGDHPIEVFDCGAVPCAPSGQTFTLSVQATVSPTPAPTSSPEDGGDEPPPVTTPREEFLDARLALLKREIAGDAQAVFDGVDELQEGEERTLTLALDVPPELVAQLRGNQLFEGGELYVAHVVRAELAGDGFEIRSSSDLSQGARNGTWEWRVRPVGSGSRELALTITMTMNGEGVERTREVFVTRSYGVAASWPFKIKRFFAASWQWLIGTAITLVLAYLGMRKKKQPAPEEPASPPRAV
jgi:hypothetical protein